MKTPIVFATDHNFVMPSCVAILSLLESSDSGTEWDINVLLSPGVTEEDKEILSRQVKESGKNAQIRFVEIGKVFLQGYETRGISNACYNRLLIPWLLPEYDKIIYSDTDVIFKGDISYIYQTDLKDNYVAGVTGEVWSKGAIRKYLLKLGVTPEKYINSGFLLINSKLQREKGLNEKYMELVKRRHIYQDQDIINIACRDRIAHLPEKINLKPSVAAMQRQGEVDMIHYIGLKPWNHFTYCWDDWWSVCKKSVVYNPQRYHSLSAHILDLKSRFKVLHLKTRENLKFRYKLLTY